MSGSTLKNDFADFVQFATRRMEGGEATATLEDLVREWRNDAEYLQSVADVRQGIADDANGLAEQATEAFADLRRRLAFGE